MNITVENELATIEEATAILLEKMSPAKVALLLANLRVGAGDYAKAREQLFAKETVATLFDEAGRIRIEPCIVREEPPKP
jgi:hypothetical protein